MMFLTSLTNYQGYLSCIKLQITGHSVIFKQSRGLMSCFDLGLVITLLVIKDTLVISLQAMCRNLNFLPKSEFYKHQWSF